MNERRPTCKEVCERADALIESGAIESGAIDARMFEQKVLPRAVCGDGEWEALRIHLLLCPPCLEYVRQIGMTIEALRRLPGCAGERARASVMEIFERWSRQRSGATDPSGEQGP